MWLTENIESGLSVTVVASKASLTGPVAPVGNVWIIDLWQQDCVFSSHTLAACVTSATFVSSRLSPERRDANAHDDPRASCSVLLGLSGLLKLYQAEKVSGEPNSSQSVSHNDGLRVAVKGSALQSLK